MSNRPNRRASASARVAAAQAQSRGRTIWIIVGVAVVVALALVIAVAVTGSDDAVEGGGPSPSGGTVVPSGDLSQGTVDVTGESLPGLTRGASTDPAVGQTIPTVAGESFDGSAISIAPGGKPKVVMLLAHWCPHCQAEVPRIQQWLDANGMPSDVDLIAISTSASASRPNYPPGDWLRGEGWSVPTMVDDGEGTAIRAFGLTSYPFFVVVDDTGAVVFRTSGELSETQWEALVDAARTGIAPAGGGSGESSPAG
jgi:thiol-disulfide isomerase/thioredoxin